MADALGPIETSELARLELSQARARLQHAVGSLKGEALKLNLPRRLTASLDRHPWLWLTSAFAVGALLGRLTRPG